MQFPWAVENELCKLARTEKLEEALVRLRVLNVNEQVARVTILADWVRGGAETYLYEFTVDTIGGERVALVLKAYITFPGPFGIDEYISELVARRNLLASHGVHVPVLHYAGDGVVLEQRIPYSLSEVEAPLRDVLPYREQLHRIATCLDSLGFQPVSWLDDLRTDKQSIYMIDFGHDLGPQGIRYGTRWSEDMLTRWLSQHGQQAGWTSGEG